MRTFFSGHTSIGQYPILRFGTPEQKQAYLPASTRGERIMAFGLTEPEAGSNPLEMTSTYRRDGDRFLLNGVKYLISNGGIADTVIAFAYPADRTRRRAADQRVYRRYGRRHVQREDLPAKLGMPTTNTGMFEMTDHPVPVENLLGREGRRFSRRHGHAGFGAVERGGRLLGCDRRLSGRGAEYCQTRHQHGKPIGRHQLVQEHVAAIELARNASAADDRAGGRREASRRKKSPATPRSIAAADMQVAQAKLFATNAAWDAADRAVQVFGGRGWSNLYRVGRHLQDVRVCRIYEGTDEILKLKIAAALLGKDFAAFS